MRLAPALPCLEYVRPASQAGWREDHMGGPRPTHERLGGRIGTGSIALLMVAFFVSNCAAYRTPVSRQTVAEARRATCDDFARAEVKRLGESVPAALAKGFFIGLSLDLLWVAEALYVGYGERPLQPLPAPPSPRGLPLASWAIGVSQLPRDAGRTNEEVYQQAVEICMAPVRLTSEFGRQDARVATSLEVLADCYTWQHRYALAEPLRREAITIWEGVFRPDDQRVARALDEHARVLRLLHRDEEAGSESQRAAMIRAQINRERERAPRTAEEHAPSVSCGFPLSATLFVVCRDTPRGQNVGTPPDDRP
jgi:tetratricopeptide repeat protein